MTLQISQLVPMFTMTQRPTFMALFPPVPRPNSLQPAFLSPPADLFVAHIVVLVLSCEERLSLRTCLSLSREEG